MSALLWCPVIKEELQLLQRRLEEREAELKRLKDDGRPRVESHHRAEGGERDTEMLHMKRVLETLTSANDEKEQRIKELEESLTKCKEEQVKDKLKEDDYDQITDDPLAPIAMEVDPGSRVLKGEAGRRSGETSTDCVEFKRKKGKRRRARGSDKESHARRSKWARAHTRVGGLAWRATSIR